MAKFKSSNTGKTIRDVYLEAAGEVRSAVKDYWLNTLYLEGTQWLRYVVRDNISDSADIAEVENRLNLVNNRMLANHRTLIGSLTSSSLVFEVQPSQGTTDSIYSATVATNILAAIAQEDDWHDHLRRSFITAMFKGGSAALYTDYAENSNRILSGVLPISEFVVEPGVRKAEDSRWWIRIQILDPDVVRSTYNLGWTPQTVANAGVNPVFESSPYAGSKNEYGKAQAMVYTYYERPNPLTPKGRVMVEVDGKLVQEMDWPYPFEGLNLSVGVDVLQDHKWWGLSHYTGVRSMQNGVNMATSVLSEHLTDVGSARLMAPQSQSDRIQAAYDEPGTIIPYQDGVAAPGYLQPPQLPNWLVGIPDLYRSAIDDLMAVHDVKRGVTPANLESAAALQTLAELDGTPSQTTLVTLAKVFTSHARRVLKLVENRNIDSYTGTIDTGNGVVPIHPPNQIHGEDRVVIPADAMLPKSKAAMHQLGMVLLNAGVITTLDELARVTQSADLTRSVTSTNPDIGKARMENIIIGSGGAPVPAKFDDHTIHMAELNKWRKSIFYQAADLEVKRIADAHYDAHMQLAGEEAAMTVSKLQQDQTGLLAGATTSGAPAPMDVPNMPPMPEPPPDPNSLPVPEGEPLPEFDPDSIVP